MKKRMLLVALALVLVIIPLSACTKEATAKPIVIGVPTSLGCPGGYEGLVGVQMAVDEINTGGGVDVGGVKRLLKVESIDTRDFAPGVPVSDCLMAYEKLILEKKPDALLVGALRSEAFIAAMDIVAEYKIIHIDGGALSPLMEQRIAENYDKYKYNFRICHNATYMAGAVEAQLESVREKYNFSKLYIVQDDISYAYALMGALPIEQQGWEVVGQDAMPLGTTDFSVPLLKARDAGAEVILTAFCMPESMAMAKQMHDMKVPALQLGVFVPIQSEDAWQSTEGKIEGMITVAGLGYVPLKKYPKSVQFFNKFKEYLRRCPEGTFSGTAGYDAVYVLAQAIERAGSLDADALVSALEETDYQGVIGRIRFSPAHQAIFGDDPDETACVVSFQWQEGKRVVVLPEGAADGEIELPSWIEQAR